MGSIGGATGEVENDHGAPRVKENRMRLGLSTCLLGVWRLLDSYFVSVR